MRRKPNSASEMGLLFKDLPTAEPSRKFLRPDVPVWTAHKANFIQRYLTLFIQITKHGTYIDGFAGPQRSNMENAWSARLALQIRPPLLRHFFLCEQNAKSFQALLKCVAEVPLPKGRTVQLYEGDFNKKVDEILESKHITEKEATSTTTKPEDPSWISVRVSHWHAERLGSKVLRGTSCAIRSLPV